MLWFLTLANLFFSEIFYRTCERQTQNCTFFVLYQLLSGLTRTKTKTTTAGCNLLTSERLDVTTVCDAPWRSAGQGRPHVLGSRRVRGRSFPRAGSETSCLASLRCDRAGAFGTSTSSCPQRKTYGRKFGCKAYEARSPWS